MFSKKWFLLWGFAAVIAFYACNSSFLRGFNVFSVEDDIALGKRVSQQIESDRQQFPILPERGNEEVYRYIRGITTKILNTGRIQYKDKFAWEVKIIDDINTLNAFATPGGYIYVYTGLIKFLDTEDQLAGVMGHEIAHSDLRHSTRQMTKAYGISTLLSVITGKADPGLMEQVALSLVNLKFSRGHETESDEYSVVYLCNSGYDAAGAAGFFKKLEGSSAPPEFLSTHPDSGNRVVKIEGKAEAMSCAPSKTNLSRHQQIKNLLR
ncbi:MAG: M48 family metallopeptidase [Bacteroidota bacterium]